MEASKSDKKKIVLEVNIKCKAAYPINAMGKSKALMESVIFKQKRIGINKTYFNIHKLRSMKQNTGDIPTHLLTKEEQDNMILKIGRFIRKASIDELPQFVDIVRGRMSLIGPRPALWNQDDLIANRDKYGANDVRPGLTGLAQISGRDELSIEKNLSLMECIRMHLEKVVFLDF